MSRKRKSRAVQVADVYLVEVHAAYLPFGGRVPSAVEKGWHPVVALTTLRVVGQKLLKPARSSRRRAPSGTTPKMN